MKCLLELSKKFLLLILMILLPINSFAAVSVSDGSAFVSKSEFSSTINNISNRMSLIENTLDAKIDSLVSSYLSRNGIWNGDKQTLAQTSKTFSLMNIIGNGSSTTVTAYYHKKGETTFGTYTTVDVSSLNLTNGKISNIGYIINNVSKTGLMCLIGKYYSSGSPTDFAFFRTQSNYDADASLVMGFNYRIISSSNSATQTGGLASGEVDAATYQWGVNILQNPAVYYKGNATYWHIPETRTISYFFINKGEKVRAIVQSYIKNNSSGLYRCQGNVVFAWESATVY